MGQSARAPDALTSDFDAAVRRVDELARQPRAAELVALFPGMSDGQVFLMLDEAAAELRRRGWAHAAKPEDGWGKRPEVS